MIARVEFVISSRLVLVCVDFYGSRGRCVLEGLKGVVLRLDVDTTMLHSINPPPYVSLKCGLTLAAWVKKINSSFGRASTWLGCKRRTGGPPGCHCDVRHEKSVVLDGVDQQEWLGGKCCGVRRGDTESDGG
jgi:hypothetical protein